MNRSQLQQRLKDEKIDPEAYSIDGGMSGEVYVLSNEGGGWWSVYYSERGLRRNEQRFNSESDACHDLFRRLIADPTAKQ